MIASEFVIDERSTARELPDGHVHTVLASRLGPTAVYLARSATGWTRWAGWADGRPKNGVVFPVPVEVDQPPDHIAARRMTEWWLERHGWNPPRRLGRPEIQRRHRPHQAHPRLQQHHTHPEEDRGGH